MSATFVNARSLDEALAALAAGARPVAGGTDLVVAARSGKAPLPDSLLAIHELDELRGIERGEGLRLGALVTHAELADDDVVRTRYTALADACAIVGSVATRENGTIGGNLMNASPAMETGGPLVCFGATVTLRSATATRELPLADLLVGPGRTSAAADELLVAVDVPAPPPGAGSAYVRLEYRRQMEIAVVGATCVAALDGGRVSHARVAITALAPTVVRVSEAETALVGSDGGAEAALAAGEAAARAAAPIDDVRASAAYRRAMAAVITRRAVAAAVARANGVDVPVPASDSTYGRG
ncbi:MAG TPA: FAD binding domain-containing protein [Gaiellaceae bacterium]|nr:FAD binding domain-containing protein [Gaiellaceae bacterium]